MNRSSSSDFLDADRPTGDSKKPADGALRNTPCRGLRVHPLPIALLLLLPFLAASLAEAAPSKPNVLILYADDLGYGDPHCYNPERGKIPTPAIDKLAAEGMRFTDAHSSSGVCTPSRYSLLTGRYHWRTVNQAGVLNGGSPPLPAPKRVTQATLAAEHGYRTACFGKWHLGLSWANDGVDQAMRDLAHIDFAQPITDGPLQHGFHTFF